MKRLLLAAFGACLALQASAETVRAAVASNFAAPMRDIAAAFEAESGHPVELSFGSSGKFYAQIQNGAPFHVFLSADQAKPKTLQERTLALPDSRFTYAVGGLALWSPRGDVPVAEGVGNAEILKSGAFKKLALANPKLAPYGAAAVEVLDNLGLKETTRSRWVQGENISQTYQFVASGNADVGFVALSQIQQGGRIRSGAAWIVPVEFYSPIRQDAVLLRAGANNSAARALLDFLRGERAGAILESYGYHSGG